MISNPIGDLLIRIKNAYLARHRSLVVPYSSLKENLAKLLTKEGYLEKVNISGRSSAEKSLKIDLKYQGKRAAILGIRQISKPGLRIYVEARRIPQSRHGQRGLVILSTPKGLISGSQAKKQNLGGELLCEVW